MRLIFSAVLILTIGSYVNAKRYYLMRLPNGGFGPTEKKVLAPAPPPPPTQYNNVVNQLTSAPHESPEEVESVQPVVNFGQSHHQPAPPVNAHSGPVNIGRQGGYSQQNQVGGGQSHQQSQNGGGYQSQSSSTGHTSSNNGGGYQSQPSSNNAGYPQQSGPVNSGGGYQNQGSHSGGSQQGSGNSGGYQSQGPSNGHGSPNTGGGYETQGSSSGGHGTSNGGGDYQSQGSNTGHGSSNNGGGYQNSLIEPAKQGGYASGSSGSHNPPPQSTQYSASSTHNSQSSSKQIPIAAIAIISGKGKQPIDPTHVKTSEGKCEFDAKCWHVKPQVAIANGVMFDRMTGATCEECLGKCQQFQSSDSPWICRAVTYDHRWQICDLFAVSGHEKPQFLTDYYGRDYFAPTGDESCSAGSQCEDDDLGRTQVPVYCNWKDSSVSGSDSVSASDADECIAQCASKGAGCAGFSFDGSKCSFVDSPLQTNEFPSNAQGSGYYEKLCLPEELVVDPSALYAIIPNFILVGHVQEVTDATSLRECKLQCLQALEFFGFECKSAMYYPTDPDQNCLLNSETRCTQRNVFIPEDQGVQMMYFDVGETCQNRRGRNLLTHKDDPLPISDDEDLDQIWTNWTKCSTKKSYKNRFYKCKDQRDVRKCPKQTIKCSESEKGMSAARTARRRLTLRNRN